MRASARDSMVLIVGAGMLACGGDGGGGPTGNSFSIQLSVNPASLTIQQGGSGSVTLALIRGGGFTGNVTATVSGLPTGITVSVNPSPLSASTASATVTADVAASVAPGTYTATVTGTATGVGSATATYDVTVVAPPNYSLSANPAALTVQAGTSGNGSVAIARTNFTGPVALTLDSPPAGITGTFTPANATADNASLVIAVAASAAPGSYTLTVKGSATGPGDKSTTLALTVTAAANYSLAVAPSPVTIIRGQSSDLTVNIARTNFTGAIALSLSNPPAGVSGVFAPASPTGNTSTLTLSVGASTAPGNHVITVMGTASGVPTVVDGTASVVAPGDRTTTIQLVVELPASIALGATPAALTLPQGGTGQSTVTVTRVNYTQAVVLVASGMPAGMGVVLNPASVTGTTAAANVTVGLSTPIGSYPITISGTGTGVSAAQTVLMVNVTAAAIYNVEYRFGPAPDNPVQFAFQDASGSWTKVTGILDNGVYKYRMNMTSGRGGVYYVKDLSTPAARAALLAERALLDPAPWRDDGALDPLRGTGIPIARSDAPFLTRFGTTGYRNTIFYGLVAEHNQKGQRTVVAPVDITIDWQGVPSGAKVQTGTSGLSKLYTDGTDPDPFTLSGRLGNQPIVWSLTPNGAAVPTRAGALNSTASTQTIDVNGPNSAAAAQATLNASYAGIWEAWTNMVIGAALIGTIWRGSPSNLATQQVFALQVGLWAGMLAEVNMKYTTPTSWAHSAAIESSWSGAKFFGFRSPFTAVVAYLALSQLSFAFTASPFSGAPFRYFDADICAPNGIGNSLHVAATAAYLLAMFGAGPTYTLQTPSPQDLGIGLGWWVTLPLDANVEIRNWVGSSPFYYWYGRALGTFIMRAGSEVPVA